MEVAFQVCMTLRDKYLQVLEALLAVFVPKVEHAIRARGRKGAKRVERDGVDRVDLARPFALHMCSSGTWIRKKGVAFG